MMRRFLISLCVTSLVLTSSVVRFPAGAQQLQQQQPITVAPAIVQRAPTTGELVCSAALEQAAELQRPITLGRTS